jgi:hypothetical protein
MDIYYNNRPGPANRPADGFIETKSLRMPDPGASTPVIAGKGCQAPLGSADREIPA